MYITHHKNIIMHCVWLQAILIFLEMPEYDTARRQVPPLLGNHKISTTRFAYSSYHFRMKWNLLPLPCGSKAMFMKKSSILHIRLIEIGTLPVGIGRYYVVPPCLGTILIPFMGIVVTRIFGYHIISFRQELYTYRYLWVKLLKYPCVLLIHNMQQ